MQDGILDPNTTVMAIFPSPMMYAGPTEVSARCHAFRVVAPKQWPNAWLRTQQVLSIQSRMWQQSHVQSGSSIRDRIDEKGRLSL